MPPGTFYNGTGIHMHQRLLTANNLALAHIAQGAPLAQTLMCIVHGIEDQDSEISAAIFLLDEEGGRLHLGAAPSMDQDYCRAIDGIATEDLDTGAQPPATGAAIPGADEIEASRFWRSFCDAARQHGLHAYAILPIRSVANGMLGIFVSYSRQPERASDTHRQAMADAAMLASIAIARDIDAVRIKRLESTLRDSETRMALAIDGSGTGIWDRDVANGEIHYSARWKTILGYDDAEISNRIEESYTRVHPDDLAYVKAAIQDHFDQKTEIYAVDHRLRCKDGSYKWISSRGKVVSRDKDGKPLRMIGTTTDITAMRSLSERLQQSVDLLTSLANEVPGFVYQYRLSPNGDGFFSYASEGIREIYEITPEQAAGDIFGIHQIIHPDDLSEYLASLDASAAGLTPWHLDYRVILPKQGLRWRHGNARPRRLQDGSTIWHGFITDITERKHEQLFLEQTRNQLLQSEKLVAIGQLAAGVAHEINNPIGFVSSNFTHLVNYINRMFILIAEYECGASQLSPELQASITTIRNRIDIDFIKGDVPQLLWQSKEGVERVQKIVRSLRDFSRVDSAQQRHICDIHIGIESTLSIAWSELKHKAVVHKEFDPALPEIECVGSQINQVILNLLMNAAHSIETRGDIWIRTGSGGEQIFIEIADNGTGIPAEIQSRIFEPFFTTKAIGHGTGLGLSVSYGIIRDHGGRFDVKSEPGHGTTFTIWLPVAYLPQSPDRGR